MTNFEKYQLVKAPSSDCLTSMVTDLMKKNWQPVGPAKITKENDNKGRMSFTFYQTMVISYFPKDNYKMG